MRLAACLAVVGLFLASAAGAHEAEPGYRKGQIHAIQAWARISPVAGRPASVYFTLHNESKVPDILIGASSPIAKRAELHGHKMDARGVMTMPAVAKIPVPADDMVLFEPGGIHIMLFDIARAPKLRSSFPLTLRFAKGKPQTIQVTAKGLADAAPAAAMDHMSH